MWSPLFLLCLCVGILCVLKSIRLYRLVPRVSPPRYLHNYTRALDFDESVADELKKKVKLLCWVMTSPKNHKSKAVHIRDTWGKRCSFLVFMTTQNDPDLPTVVLPVKNGRGQLWKKSQEALKYIYKNYLDKVSWILKADDDTLFFPENARYLLSRYNPNDPLWIGCKMRMRGGPTFLSGGAGYIFSKEAAKIFVEKAIKDNTYCQPNVNDWADDLQTGRCFERLGVKLIDTRDEYGLHRFLPLSPDFHLKPLTKTDKESWWWFATYYKDERYFGGECCSNSTVSFHYASPFELHLFYNLMYNLRPYVALPPETADGVPASPPDHALKELQFYNKEAREYRSKADADFFRNMFKKHKDFGS